MVEIHYIKSTFGFRYFSKIMPFLLTADWCEAQLFVIKAKTNFLVHFDFRYEFEKDISFQKGCKESRCRSDLQLFATVLGTSSFFVIDKVIKNKNIEA